MDGKSFVLYCATRVRGSGISGHHTFPYAIPAVASIPYSSDNDFSSRRNARPLCSI